MDISRVRNNRGPRVTSTSGSFSRAGRKRILERDRISGAYTPLSSARPAFIAARFVAERLKNRCSNKARSSRLCLLRARRVHASRRSRARYSSARYAIRGYKSDFSLSLWFFPTFCFHSMLSGRRICTSVGPGALIENHRSISLVTGFVAGQKPRQEWATYARPFLLSSHGGIAPISNEWPALWLDLAADTSTARIACLAHARLRGQIARARFSPFLPNIPALRASSINSIRPRIRARTRREI